MKYIILFDGVCNLCNGSVNFIIDRDPKSKFQFAALQSSAGQNYLSQFHLSAESIKTIVLIEGSVLYTKSTAALRIARHLSSGWRMLYLLIVLPVFIRDACYNFVSKNRYRWFGKSQQCRIPTPELQNRFI